MEVPERIMTDILIVDMAGFWQSSKEERRLLINQLFDNMEKVSRRIRKLLPDEYQRDNFPIFGSMSIQGETVTVDFSTAFSLFMDRRLIELKNIRYPG